VMTGSNLHRFRWLFFFAASFCAWFWTTDYSTEIWQSTEERGCATGLVHTWHGWAVFAVIFILLGGITFASNGYPDKNKELVG